MRNQMALALVALFCPPILAQGVGPLDQIFYAPFDDSPNAVIARGMAEPFQHRIDAFEPGVVGNAARSEKRYNGIRFDGRGNIDLDRGTFAFFYKLLYEPAASEWASLAGVATDTEGYWSSIIQFISKQSASKQTLFDLHFFDIGRYSPVLHFEPIYKRWKKDEWHHLAVVWDRVKGVKMYEDGRLADSNWGRYHWDWSPQPRMLIFGEWQYSTRPFVVDEVHCYAACLTDPQIAQLAKGEKPTGEPIKITSAPHRRDKDLARMSWLDEDLAQLPRLAPDTQPLRITFARVDHMSDASRRIAHPFEGWRDTCWPLQRYGASIKGRQLQMVLAEGESFDFIRLFAQRKFRGRINEVLPGVGTKLLAKVDAERPVWRHRFSGRRTDRMMTLERDFGQVGQIDFFRIDRGAEHPDSLLTYSTAKVERIPPTLTGRAILGETPTRFDNAIQGMTVATDAWTITSEPFGGFQFITPTLEESVAMDGVVVKFVAKDIASPTPVRILVTEPVSPSRTWLDGEVILEPGKGVRTYTIHLKGRPVVSYPKTSLTIRDKPVDDPGREVGVMVTAGNPVTWLMGDGGTQISLCTLPVEQAMPIALADQIEWAREAYAETNEGKIWNTLTYHGWGRLYYPLRWLVRFAPEHRVTMELATRVRWREESLPYEEPANEHGAPEWAFGQMQAMDACRSVVHWIIDNRQTDNGEFGGVWGDDTDMTEYWTCYALAGVDDGKIAASLKKFWRNLYKECLVEGVSRTIRDNLHSYEEGMGAICHEMLLDYGNPIAVEHVMRAASHYDPKWMKQNDDGTYSFRSNFLGYGGVYTEGKFGQDTGVNWLMLFPAAYLTWYNQHPAATPYIHQWKRSPETGGIVGDAYLRLAYGNDRDAFVQQYVERVEKVEPRKWPMQLNALLDEVGMRPEWAEKFVSGAAANQWRFFQGNLPDYAGYSPRMTEYFWLAYRASGDMKYLVQSYKQAAEFVNNQFWLYTDAQPSTDRIPLPRTSVIRARIGALAANRGASGCFWPRYAFSYEEGGPEIAALVTDNTDTSAAVRLYGLTDGPHVVKMRLWRMLPGTYEVTLRHEGAGDVLWSKTVDVDRGSRFELTLPARRECVLRFKAIETRALRYDLPDPAVSLADVFLEYGDHLHVTVHNVGVKPVKNLTVRVRDGFTGEVVGERVIEHIAAPLDLYPKTALIELQNVNAITKESIIVELDPDEQHPDLNRHNNRVVFRY